MGKKREGDIMKVPYLDLKSQYLSIKEEINKEVLDTLKSSNYSLGPKVEIFEKNFSAYCNSKYAVGGETIRVFKELLSVNFDDILQLKISNQLRFKVLNFLIDYFNIHLPRFGNIKSIAILHEIFH